MRARIFVLCLLAVGSATLGLGARARAAEAPDYWPTPGSDYETRKRAFLEHAAGLKDGGLYAQVARLELGRGPLEEEPIRAGIATIKERKDGADFVANALLRMLHYGNNPLLKPELRAQIKQALLGLKYWVDEPGGKDLLSVWSENHQINYHSAELLAGELFPDDTFTNNGKKGRDHVAAARKRILLWIDVKARTGFNEWDSNNCYINTSAAVMNLAELAQDPEVQKRAAMIADVMFLDIAMDSFRGTYGTAHGRTYPGAIVSGGLTEDTAALQRMGWGLGALGKPNAAAIYLATSKRYRVARTIEEVAQQMPEELTNRERQSLRVEDASKLGLDFENPEHYFVVYAGGKASSLANIEKSLRVTDKMNFYRYGLVMRPWVVAVRDTYKELAKQGKPVPDLDNSSLATVNKIAYRTPDYQLSTVQDWRKGAPGLQQHLWQATLGPETLVFTINPGGSRKYWQGRVPRLAQHKNLLIAIYDIPAERPPGPKTIVPPDASGDAVPSPAPSEEALDPRTLAVFRRASFDEVTEAGGWFFGRKGKGYIALRAQRPAAWTKDGVYGDEGLISEGRKNVWICQLGREKTDGPFAAWTKKVAAAPLELGESSVKYRAPGLGQVTFAWEGPLRVNGKAIALTDYARFDNPYVKAPYGTGRYEIAHAGYKLVLDFKKGERTETLPARAPQKAK